MSEYDYLPPELDLERRRSERRRRIADLLTQQSLQPLEEPRTRGNYAVAISPFQGLAQLGTAFAGRKQMDRADEADAEVGRKYQDIVNAEMAKINNPTNTGNQLPGNQTPDPMAAIQQGMLSPIPQVRAAATAMYNAKQEELNREDAQAARAEESKLAREQRQAELEARLADNRTTREEANALRLQIAELAAGNRAPTVTEIVKDGKPVKVDARTGAVIGASPVQGAGKAMSATAQKELFEAEDMIASSQNAVDILNSILTPDPTTGKSQNDIAYGGGFAPARMLAAKFIPGSSEATDASVDLKNKVTGQALQSLKAVFGGAPTEAEHRLLIEIQGSMDMTPNQRESVFKRAIDLAKRRIEVNKKKAEQLRKGEYFSEQAESADGDWEPL